MTKRIAQITDIHLFANKDDELLGVKTHFSFEAVIDLIKTHPKKPDLILLTGDLSQDHQAKSYEHVLETFNSLAIPTFYVPGNHDDISLMRSVLSSSVVSTEKHHLLGHFQLILLNSQKPHAVEGYLARSELDFLEVCLKKYPQHHSLIAFHHQPVPVGSVWLDKLGLQNADELWSILAQYPQRHTILFGHVHQEFHAEKNGIHCYSTPSTCVQFKKDSKDFALEKIPPAYRWVDLYADGTLKTGICRIDQYVGFFDPNAKGY